jgi:hypothetical protein
MKITRRVAALGLALTLALSGCSLFTVDVESEEHKEAPKSTTEHDHD